MRASCEHVDAATEEDGVEGLLAEDEDSEAEEGAGGARGRAGGAASSPATGAAQAPVKLQHIEYKKRESEKAAAVRFEEARRARVIGHALADSSTHSLIEPKNRRGGPRTPTSGSRRRRSRGRSWPSTRRGATPARRTGPGCSAPRRAGGGPSGSGAGAACTWICTARRWRGCGRRRRVPGAEGVLLLLAVGVGGRGWVAVGTGR